MSDFDASRAVFTPDRAAELSGFTRRQLDYWRTTNLVQPSTDERLSPQRPVRLYDYVDMMSLLVIAQLHDHLSTRRIRMVVNRLRRLEYESPLTQVVFGVAKGKKGDRWVVCFQHRDGSWEDERTPNQLVMPEALDLGKLRAKIRRSVRRPVQSVGRMERRRGALGSKPVFEGTRIPVATVKRYLTHGVSTEEILKAYPALHADDIHAVKSGELVG